MAVTKDHKVGIYARLSKEDSRAGESVSIENQKLLLMKHVKEMGWELVDIYQDDGWSGTNQNRPALQRLLQDVKDKRINTVLIKDLSRLGRNYLEVGNLSEVYLPEHGCELISLNEKLDEMAVFRNWFNEQHSRSTSTKVKAIKRMRAQDGKYVGSIAPYGYRKSPDNKHLLIPDEATAPVIRKLFEMRAGGMGFNTLARHLNDTGVVSPREYFYQQKNTENPYKGSHYWNCVTVSSFLRNEVYIGNMVSLKYASESYKNHKLVHKPKDEWIKVENVHEPLIERELWDRCQALTEKRYIRRPRKDGTASIFSGLLVCADCEMKMRSTTHRKTRKNGNLYEYTSFTCRTCNNGGQAACTPHTIGENVLHELVVEQIRAHAMLVHCDEKRIIEKIASAQDSEAATSKKTCDSELKHCRKRLTMLGKLIDSLYEDRVTGVVPETVFKNLIQKYEQERVEREETIVALEKRMTDIQQNNSSAATWVDLIKQHTTLETLDAETLLTLIDRIIISEPGIIDGKRICDIEIVYNHVGNMDWLTEGQKIVEMEVAKYEQAV